AGLEEALDLLRGPLLKRDPGISMAMLWGMLPVVELEPEAAEELAEAVSQVSPISIADSLVELRHQAPGFGEAAAKRCATALESSLKRSEVDDGLGALAEAILADLKGDGEGRQLRGAVGAALEAFGEQGTLAAHSLAKKALVVASQQVGLLENLSVTYRDEEEGREPRRRAMTLLRDLDATLLETRLLNHLLLLDRPPNMEATGVEAVDDLDARLARWLLDDGRRRATATEIKQQATLHQRQLRTLLHLIDGGSTDFGDDNERRLRVRARWTTAVRTFTDYLQEHPSSRLTRAIIATISRTFDALVRDGAAEPIDVFLFTALYLNDPNHMAIIAEASMQPDVVQLLLHYLDSIHESESSRHPPAVARLTAFERFLHGFPSQTSLRGEAFRLTAWTLARALRQVASVESLQALVPANGSGRSSLATVDDAMGQLHQLVVGAERRCCDRVSASQTSPPPRHALANAVAAAAQAEGEDTSDVERLIAAEVEAAEANLPPHIAQLIATSFPRLNSLPVLEKLGSLHPIPLVHKSVSLPDWMPARRVLGGFYVMNQLGGGAVGSVFVVKRAEERHDADAEKLALKVPEYNATAARTMSEKEFLKLFREEAGALLSIPEHPNLARFVTFDAGAKPKPILVMELIEGMSLERSLASASLDSQRAVAILDGILQGLSAMHDAGVAHLDVKPSNAILREQSDNPVLVDFGLAGRHVRPGCATLCYGAPEIWETAPGNKAPGPASAADVYAFGCLAFELLTGKTLFDGNSDVAIITAHITHDGLPPAVERFANTSLQPFAMFLHQCLRYAPEARASAAHLRDELKRIAPLIEKQQWPLGG
ncbi:MAG: serine/threonine-protein kinase, partial [Myxococcota bacterium]